MTDLDDGFTAEDAPGAPGSAPTWTSSAKQLVGCALGPSRLWFTLGHGVVNEVYHPRVDLPQIRDLGFIVADDRGFWVEVKRLGSHELLQAAPAVPAATVLHRHERFELRLRIVPDPDRDVLLLEVALDGDPGLRPYVLLAPHVGGSGRGNTAEVAEHRGRRVLWAEQGPFGIALTAAGERQCDAMGRASAGFVGASDGWQDFARNGRMCWRHRRAVDGNVALLGALPRRAVLALGLGTSKEAAATLALSALARPFEQAWDRFVDTWVAWHSACQSRCGGPPELPEPLAALYAMSATVLRVHQDKTYPGAMVASLSVPWGNTSDQRGGYHLVWPRDLVECGGALLALGGEEEARDILRYLVACQHADGHWYQNQWLGGKPYWEGVQLDEAAFPVLLASALQARGALDGIEVADMVHRALAFVVRTGPASQQDRWEEDAGVNTFTLAVCIAALVEGACWLEPAARDVALGIADFWNARVEIWTTTADSALSRRFGTGPYYVRVAPARAVTDGATALRDTVPIKNRAVDAALEAGEQVGTDFLQLVRFGLRRADDPVVLDTLRVSDALLEVRTPAGRAWHRYNGDGYGEHADGAPFDGVGEGRAWPLLTGERGHYELLRGQDPLPFLEAMAAMSGACGMLPEQVWDAPPLAARHLFPGRPSGSAMPLAWAHAEFVKLARSRQLGRPFDRPGAVWERYRGQRPVPGRVFWCQHAPIDHLPAGATLAVALHGDGVVHWGVRGWQELRDTPTRDTGLGLHLAELATDGLVAGDTIELTYRCAATGRWAGRDYRVLVG